MPVLFWLQHETGAPVLPPVPPAASAPANPATCPQPSYSYGPWVKSGEYRWFEGTWVLERSEYERTRTDACDGSTTTERKSEGQTQLWSAVPKQRVAAVNKPTGDVRELTGSPLRWADPPAGLRPAQVGPADPGQTSSPTPQGTSGNGGPGNGGPAKDQRTRPPGTLSNPFFPGAALLTGVLVAAWDQRKQRGQPPPPGANPGHVASKSFWSRVKDLGHRAATFTDKVFGFSQVGAAYLAWRNGQGKGSDFAWSLAVTGFKVLGLVAVVAAAVLCAPIVLSGGLVALGVAAMTSGVVALSVGVLTAAAAGGAFFALDGLASGKPMEDVAADTLGGAFFSAGMEAAVFSPALIKAAQSTPTVKPQGPSFHEQAVEHMPPGISMERMRQLLKTPTDALTAEEVQIVKAFRTSVPAPTTTTVMQKTIPSGQIDELLDPAFKYRQSVRGYVARQQDVAALRTPQQQVDELALRYEGNPYITQEGNVVDSVGVIRFLARQPDKLEIPFGGNNPAGAKSMGGTFVYPRPFSGNGTTEAKTMIIPESYANTIPFADGATVWQQYANGREVLRGVYSEIEGRWIPWVPPVAPNLNQAISGVPYTVVPPYTVTATPAPAPTQPDD